HNDSVSTTQTTVPATTQTNEVVTDLLTVKSTHVEQHNDSVSTTQATVPATTQTNEAVTDLSTVKSTHVEQHNDSVSTTQTTVPATTQTNEAVTGLMAVNIEQLPTIQAKATAASTEGSLNITPIEDSALSMSQASNSENNSGIGQGKLAKLINSAQAANNTLINKAAIGESIGSFANFQFENTVVVEQVDSGLSSMNNASTSQLNWNLTSSSASTNLANSLAEQLTMISNPGNKLITINLIPKNLGNVQVTIKVEQNQVSLAVKVQNEEVKQLFGTVTNKLDQILQNQSFANNNVTSKDQSLNNFFQPNFSFDSSDSQRQLFQREKKNGNFVPKVRNGSFSKQQKAKQEETDLKSTISILV
ncbi:flagellar hook-length control protein FliK, partial [Liquorilactobacillus nagelii]